MVATLTMTVDYIEYSRAMVKFIISRKRMELLYNNNIINEIVTKLFRHRRNDYSEFQMEHLLASEQLTHQLLPLCNSSYERLQVSLFTSTPNPTRHPLPTCILFMHGYGSNRLECTNILPFLGEELSLCSFDFSGSGKSQGDTVTYGSKEKEDIHCTLNYLRRMGFKRFVLWGRSMGATSSLLYCLKYKPEDVVLQVIDSAFFSFQMIAFEIANKNVKAPEFMISFGLEMAKKNCSKFEFNPFQIELSNVGDCRVPALFVYCEEDNVINSQNTHMLCSRFKSTFQKLTIEENHNTIRSSQTVSKMFSLLNKYLKVPKKTHTIHPSKRQPIQPFKSLFIDTTPRNVQSSKSLLEEHSMFDHQTGKAKEGRKGIKRVQKEQPAHSKNFDDYGIWVACKFKEDQAQRRTGTSVLKNNGQNTPKMQLSLKTSFVLKKGEGVEAREFTSLQKKCLNSSESGRGSVLSKKGKLSTVRSLGGKKTLNNSKYL